MPRRRDEDTGLYQQAYPDEDIVAVLEGTRLSTTEVANELDYHRTTAHDRLTTLEEQGEIESKTVGNTLMWELSE